MDYKKEYEKLLEKYKQLEKEKQRLQERISYYNWKTDITRWGL